jgi:hypothetical protein
MFEFVKTFFKPKNDAIAGPSKRSAKVILDEAASAAAKAEKAAKAAEVAEAASKSIARLDNDVAANALRNEQKHKADKALWDKMTQPQQLQIQRITDNAELRQGDSSHTYKKNKALAVSARAAADAAADSSDTLHLIVSLVTIAQQKV